MLDKNTYQALHQKSIEDPESFWSEQATAMVSWFKPWDTVLTGDFTQHNIEWFAGAELNVSYNCIDRHLDTRGDQTAIIWEGDNPDESQHITYKTLHKKVCQLANTLKAHNVKKGDRICIYMPMIPEAAYAMLACARIGATHSVVFGGFSPEALKNRILDADCSLVITADEGIRGNKIIPLKTNVDTALHDCPNVHTVMVVQRTGNDIAWKKQRDVWYHEAMKKASDDCEPIAMNAMDPLFILYTSGSTGKPKGVCHTTGGYLVYAALTHKHVFDLQAGDIYWCTADVGWITGHSYSIYGPLCNGTTTLLFEGVPNYPSSSRCWEVVDKHNVTLFYTAPTAIRALMRDGDAPVKITSRKTLRLLGTVGEPINPDVWHWYHTVVGDQRCPIVDTWWQTETGGIMLTPFPHATTLKPGAASWPFFGVQAAIVDDNGTVLEGEATGKLMITHPWPGMMNTVYGNHDRFIQTYFSECLGMFTTGDGAHRDKDGYFWITGRVDDVINVSGHRLGTAEIESALLQHHGIAEAAVVGFSHDIKGEGIYAFVTPKVGVTPTDDLKQTLIQLTRDSIGPIATPDVIQWAEALPKTRSGKIMRRILRKIANNDLEDFGDTSTLADPEVIDALVAAR